ncbi:cupredoxin domain-containing protein [Frankia sp. AgB32]|uniref:cupredoxin domain-containing protein n=1 Tax=Frankia sp. AgB32 TaxID=631119 RepID=UPI00200BFE12|nr:cupredoxin domain-containing protein [Frankia sp. AgB32]MCK9895165.1 cupredoxin domain-containing protein [Frankia sp. AgB32]
MTCTADRAVAAGQPRRDDRPERSGAAPSRGGPGRRAGLALLTVVLAVLLGAAGCGGKGGSSPSAGPTLAATDGADGVQVFAVTGLPSMKFSASELVAKPGRIRVDFSVAAGSAPHNFVVPTIPGANTKIVSAGDKQSVTFTVTKPGDYQVVCTLHPNMTATLKIT